MSSYDLTPGNVNSEKHQLINKKKKRPQHKPSGKYLKSMVYGGLDGLISTFAVVAGVTGADLSVGVLLILGLASLFADGVSMAVGDYISTKAESDHLSMEKAAEEADRDEDPKAERESLITTFEKKGASRRDAELLTNTLSKYHDLFIEVAMSEKLGLVEDDDSPVKNAIVTFFSFVIFGSTPIISYVVARAAISDPWFKGVNIVFIIACIFTSMVMFGLGALTSRFTSTAWWKSGLLVMINGSFAAGIAYLIGYLLAFLDE